MRGDIMEPSEAAEYADRIIELRAQKRKERERRRGILGLLLSLPASGLARLQG